MKGDKECEEYECAYLRYCKWHPDECYGKPWQKEAEKDEASEH